MSQPARNSVFYVPLQGPRAIDRCTESCVVILEAPVQPRAYDNPNLSAREFLEACVRSPRSHLSVANGRRTYCSSSSRYRPLSSSTTRSGDQVHHPFDSIDVMRCNTMQYMNHVSFERAMVHCGRGQTRDGGNTVIPLSLLRKVPRITATTPAL